ncbi:DsbA family protein [Aquifex pyrophilus]
MLRLLGLLTVLFIFTFASLYEELIKEQVKELPLDKAVVVGKGSKELIVFVNPDCPHCRKEWKKLRNHLDKLKIYVFVIPFKGWGEENLKKAYYIVCSENPQKALDEVLLGKLDDKEINPNRCEKLNYHLKAADSVGLRAVPLNIIPDKGKVIEGESPKLFYYLEIEE